MLSRCRKRRLLGLLACALVIGCADDAAPAEDAGRNLVLLSVDTLRRDGLRAYSDEAPALPHLDAFAERSAVFREAVSTASWTLPATASLLTGVYPDRHGATAPRRRLPADFPTLARALAERGFETVALTEGGYLDRAYGLHAGFQRYDEWGATERDQERQGSLPRHGRRTRQAGRKLFDRAIAFLRAREAAAPPFFLFLQTYSLHDYYRVRPWTRERLPELELAKGTHYEACLKGERRGDPEDWQGLRTLYRAELEYLDEGFGRLRQALADAGLERSTWVVVLSDHGEGFEPERGRIHHGGRLHEDQLRIPLLVAGPGIVARELATPVSLVDVMPTILELVDRPASGGDGHSFAALLHGGDASLEPRTLYAMEHHHDWEDGRRIAFDEPREEALAVAAISAELWCIDRGEAGTELYDMGEDPRQRAPLAQEDERARAPLELARERLRRRSVGERHEPSPEVLRQLEELGYAGGSE